MYYDNKSTFYIKQYGPAVFTIVVSLVLVLGGLYIYLSSNIYESHIPRRRNNLQI